MTDLHRRMENGWSGGLPETACGGGSTSEATRRLRSWLPELLDVYRIRTVADAGAGDLAIWRGVNLRGVEVSYYDLVPRRPEVVEFNICEQVLPTVDLIVCRMVLNHLTPPEVAMALGNFALSRSRYVLLTNFDARTRRPDKSEQFRRIDLKAVLGSPLVSVPDGIESSCSMMLWGVESILAVRAPESPYAEFLSQGR